MMKHAVGLLLLDGRAVHDRVGEILSGRMHSFEAIAVKLTDNDFGGSNFENRADVDDVVKALGIEFLHSVATVGKQLDLPTLCQSL